MAELLEIANRVWVARHKAHDVNVCVIGGERGAVVVDTGESEEIGHEILAQVRLLGAGEVVAVVNTHDHFDHIGGNAVFTTARVIAHENAVVPTATETISSVKVLDLGDRVVELFHPGRGHTAGDLLVRVPDVDVLLAGDLLEEATAPWYGDDCWPLDWPLALDMALSMATTQTVVVPGHGAPVDYDFLLQQRGETGIVAETLRDLASRGVPQTEALAAAQWPFPGEHIAAGVARAYEQLPRAQKQLPLV